MPYQIIYWGLDVNLRLRYAEGQSARLISVDHLKSLNLKVTGAEVGEDNDFEFQDCLMSLLGRFGLTTEKQHWRQQRHLEIPVSFTC